MIMEMVDGEPPFFNEPPLQAMRREIMDPSQNNRMVAYSKLDHLIIEAAVSAPNREFHVGIGPG